MRSFRHGEFLKMGATFARLSAIVGGERPQGK
jgi:hypothetical protein